MIELNNLTKKFEHKTLFEHLSFSFPSHGIVALLGDSGSGKTTLLRMMAGLDRRFEGEIRKEGNVAVCFQEYRLFPRLSALDNITQIALRHADTAQIASAKNLLLELGFSEEEIRYVPEQLSGGMKQRVSLARALLSDAQILLLDEPFKELDATLSKIVCRKLREAAIDRLVVLSVHTEEEAVALGARVLRIGS